MKNTKSTSPSLIREIINSRDLVSFQEFLKDNHTEISDTEQIFLIHSRNSGMISAFIKARGFSKKAQLEFIKYIEPNTSIH